MANKFWKFVNRKNTIKMKKYLFITIIFILSLPAMAYDSHTYHREHRYDKPAYDRYKCHMWDTYGKRYSPYKPEGC